MPYDPNDKSYAKSGSPIAGQLERAARDQANRKNVVGGTGDVDWTSPNTGADWSKAIGGVFYGDQDSKGLIGGSHQVNPSAYLGYNGDPYRANAATAGMNPLMQGSGDQTRAGQQSLIQMLMAQANGQGPSAAQGMLQQATDRNMANTIAMQASGRGPGASGMAYQAGNQMAAANQQAAGDAANLRSQEMMQGRQLLGQSLQDTRGQDIGQQQLMFNEQAQRDQLVQEYIKMGMNSDQADQQAALKMEELKTTAYNGGQGGGSFLGGMFSSMSDENVKEDIKDAGKDLYAFLDKLDAHDYKYKDEKHGKGRRVSVMAQELEKSDLGKKFVFETADGKAVDYGKGLGTMLAAQAALHKRLKKLEKK